MLIVGSLQGEGEGKRGPADRGRKERDIEKRYEKTAFPFAFGVSHNPSIPLLSRCFCALGVIYYISLPLPCLSLACHSPRSSRLARSLSIPSCVLGSRRESVRYRCRRDTGIVRIGARREDKSIHLSPNSIPSSSPSVSSQLRFCISSEANILRFVASSPDATRDFTTETFGDCEASERLRGAEHKLN